MNFTFDRHEPDYTPIVFVMTLDCKKMKERILIGQEESIRMALKGYSPERILYDETRPLGTFILEFEHDPAGEWNTEGMLPLYTAMKVNRWKQPDLEKHASEFLTKKYSTHNPVCMYAAFKLWNNYLISREKRERNLARESFMASSTMLLLPIKANKPLSIDFDGQPKNLNLSDIIFKNIPDEHTRLELWYPDDCNGIECVCAKRSFYPVINYYLKRLNEWNLFFRKCKICGKYFLAGSQRYELCSSKCRKSQALQNKRDFDKRAKENNYDLIYKNECQSWRNKINKAKKTPDFPPEQLEKMQSAVSAQSPRVYPKANSNDKI